RTGPTAARARTRPSSSAAAPSPRTASPAPPTASITSTRTSSASCSRLSRPGVGLKDLGQGWNPWNCARSGSAGPRSAGADRPQPFSRASRASRALFAIGLVVTLDLVGPREPLLGRPLDGIEALQSLLDRVRDPQHFHVQADGVHDVLGIMP